MFRHIGIKPEEAGFLADILKSQKDIVAIDVHDLLVRLEGVRDPDDRERKIIQLAQASSLVGDGVLEIDDTAITSEGDDNGSYVMAWLWVDFSGTDLDKETNCDEA